MILSLKFDFDHLINWLCIVNFSGRWNFNKYPLNMKCIFNFCDEMKPYVLQGIVFLVQTEVPNNYYYTFMQII